MRRAALALLILGAGLVPASAADAPKLPGHWQLVILDVNEVPLFVFEVNGGASGDKKIYGSLADSGNMGKALKLGKVEAQGDGLALDFTIQGADAHFTPAGSPDAETILGSMNFRGEIYPVRLERVAGDKIVPPKPDQALNNKFGQARRERDPAAKLAKLKAAIGEEGPTSPRTSSIDELLHKGLVAAKAPEADVKAHADRWVAAAKPYGEALVVQTMGKVFEGLKGKAGFEGLAKEVAASYGPLAFAAAEAADKTLPADAAAERKLAAATKLAAAAQLVGNAPVASSAAARVAKLEEAVDAEYHAKVPPFKPAPYASRKAGTDRVVVMELFTGAQCPPCVAADVGFDALIASYKPADLITLQYHLHIPGPDPLTNKDAEDRQAYYGQAIGGTPSTFFNGKAKAGGGGGMDGAEGKFDEFRKVIDPLINGNAAAKVDLKAKLDGDTITISATATTEAVAKGKPHLRLVLVEEQVKYVGGNGLRFHHHVVRKLIGGAAGKPLVDGSAKVEETVSLADIRKFQEAYLADFESRKGGFPNPLPPIPLKDLSVVAFVQDDEDKAILQATQVELDAPAEMPKKHP